MSKEKDSTTGVGDTDEKLKVVVERSLAKQVAEVVGSLKAAAMKVSDSIRMSPGTLGNSGGGKYHFLPKAMTSCRKTLTLHIRLKGHREGPKKLGT